MADHASRFTFWRLIQLAAPFKWWMALSALLGAFTIGSSIGLMATSAFIIARAALHPSVADLAVAIVGVRFFGIARGVFRYLERLVSHQVTFSLLARLRVWFYRAIEPLAPARLMRYRSGDLLSRSVSDIETLQNLYVRVVAPPFVAQLIAVFMGLFLYGYSPSLALIVLAFMLLVGVGVPLIVRAASQGAGRQLVAVRSELNEQLVDGLQGLADLIAFGRERDQSDKAKAFSHMLIGLQSKMASITGLHNAIGALLTNLAMWSVLVIAIPMVRTSHLTGIDLPVLVLATLSSFEGVLALPLAFQYLENSLQAARRLFEIVDTDLTTKAPKPKDSLASLRPAGETRPTSVAVADLSFRYGPAEPLALDHLSFEVQPGRNLAIVGPSGAGKSTLVNLLLRFWDYEQGQILLNGRDLREYAPDDARALIGVVLQQTYLFNATVRENLLLARPEATEAELIRSAQQAQIHDFIQSLPQGYDTLIGEQGLRLSGGERQRLAIARALLKDAPIVVLDEATANLDALTERGVLRSIRALMTGRTTLMITHRLVGLEAIEEIIVLSAGRIVERGRHADLIQLDGLYRRMWDLQNQVLALDTVENMA